MHTPRLAKSAVLTILLVFGLAAPQTAAAAPAKPKVPEVRFFSAPGSIKWVIEKPIVGERIEFRQRDHLATQLTYIALLKSTKSSGQLQLVGTDTEVISWRAVSAAGSSAWSRPLQVGQDSEVTGAWDTTFYLTPDNLKAFAPSFAKVMASAGVDCMKDKAYKKVLDKVASSAVKTRTLYGVAAASQIKFYRWLWTGTFDSGCDTMKAVGKSVAATTLAALPVAKTNPRLFDVSSSFQLNFGPLPNSCVVTIDSKSGPGAQLNTPEAQVTVHKQEAECRWESERWFSGRAS